MKSKINLLALPVALLLSLISTASFAACPSPFNLTFEKAGLCAVSQWTVGPKGDGENTMTIQFVDVQTHTPQEPSASVTVALFMPDMGHGSSPTLITKNAPGAITVSKIFFIMEGAWEVRVNVGEEQQILPVEIQ